MHPKMDADTPFEICIQKETAPTETHMHDTDGVSSRRRIKNSTLPCNKVESVRINLFI